MWTYSLPGYGEMIADRVRMNAFESALRSAIRPGAVVMDIGTGTGIMALMACRFGASHVYAIEPSEVIQFARELSKANGCDDRIEFFEDISTRVSVPVRADVIVSDLRGILPPFERHIPSIIDARERLLAPGGTLIARRDTIWAAVVEATSDYDKIVGPWDRNIFGYDLSHGRRKALNEFRNARVSVDQLLTEPRIWTTIDYMTVMDADFRGALEWTGSRNGTGHGILLWFEMDLADNVRFSTGPSSPETIYHAAFFPWLEPVPLEAGQQISVELEAKLLESQYMWRWTTKIKSLRHPAAPEISFEQSLMQAAFLSPKRLHKSASDFVPQLSEEGLIRRKAMELMDGRASLEEIARRLCTEFPDKYENWQAALVLAAELSVDNSR